MSLPQSEDTTVIETATATVALSDGGIAFFDPDVSRSYLTMRDPVNLRDNV